MEMAAYVLSPERCWTNKQSGRDGQQEASSSDAQQQTPTGPQPTDGVMMRRRISRVFYESHTPVSSPVVLDLHHQPMVVDANHNEEEVIQLVERFLPQRRSPGQRSQDSGFSGYSGDSASEGSSGSGTNSNNNSPLPVPAAAAAAVPVVINKRSPLVDADAAEKALAAPEVSSRPLETDLDATPSRCMRSHVSRIYIGPSAIGTEANTAAAALAAIQCEKNYIQPVNLSPPSSGTGSNTSPDKCVGDKSLIGAVLASSRLNNNNNRSESPVADRSGDSQTALLLEHKSIVSAPPVALRPNLSWKKLSESFRRVISSGRMMTAGSASSTHHQSCIPSGDALNEDDDVDEERDQSFTDEEKSRMLLLAKRSNLRRLQDDETALSCVNRAMAMTESPQPTSRYLGGPRSSTPRKSTSLQGTAHRFNNNNNNNVPSGVPRRCSRLASEERPRVHWADAVVEEEANKQATAPECSRKQPQSSCWPDNSTWDSDTPSLEIGQQQQLNQWPVGCDYPILPAMMPIPPEPKRIRRGLRMGTQSPHVRKSGVPAGLVLVPPPPVIIPASAEFRSSVALAHHQPPYGLRWSPVEAWLKDLPLFYQPESTCALQNKAIRPHHPSLVEQSWSDESSTCLMTTTTSPATGHQSEEEDGGETYSATVTARAQVRRLQRRAHLISTEFAQLCSFIELYEESKLSALIPLFLAHVIQFIREAEAAALSAGPSGSSDDLIASLRQTCAQLVQLVTFSVPKQQQSSPTPPPCINDGPVPPVNWSLARQVTARLGQVFVSIVDTFVGREIEVLTAALESGKCVSAARLAANSLMSLGSDASRPALAPLIGAFHRPHLRPVRADLLRALSALCSSADIIRLFEQLGGLAVVFDVLCSPSGATLEEKSEAAGLLAQITSPWLDPSPDDEQADHQAGLMDEEQQQEVMIHSWPSLHLTPYISPFIAALTELSGQTDAEETLLLSTAALANLTFSHSEAVQLMTKYRTAQVLVEASSQRSKDLSVFIQDQIATILANMAAVHSARPDLVAHGALGTLLNFLQRSRPCPTSQRPAELTASERVLKKSAIALSRVCGEEDAAHQIVQLSGIERLAQLVRDPRERNYSDGVLVACLAALHKISTACGGQELERRGASDLIENRLLDVFLLYSSRPESYV